MILAKMGHVGVFGDVLTDESVGSFVRSAFPGVMRASTLRDGYAKEDLSYRGTR